MELLKTGPRFFATYVWNALDELRLKEDDYQKYFQVIAFPLIIVIFNNNYIIHAFFISFHYS